MKKLITEIHDNRSGSTYQLWGKLEDLYHPSDYKSLTLYTVWTGAKDPAGEQEKAKLMLSPDSLKNLKELLGSV